MCSITFRIACIRDHTGPGPPPTRGVLDYVRIACAGTTPPGQAPRPREVCSITFRIACIRKHTPGRTARLPSFAGERAATRAFESAPDGRKRHEPHMRGDMRPAAGPIGLRRADSLRKGIDAASPHACPAVPSRRRDRRGGDVGAGGAGARTVRRARRAGRRGVADRRDERARGSRDRSESAGARGNASPGDRPHPRAGHGARTCAHPRAPGVARLRGAGSAGCGAGYARLVRPRVGQRASDFTQVFPSARAGIAPAYSPGAAPRRPRPTPRPSCSRRTTSPISRRRAGRRHGGDRRRLRRPRPPSPTSARLPRDLRAARVHDRERLLPEGQRERRSSPLPAAEHRLGGRGIARPRRGLRALPELPHPARRGQLAAPRDLDAAVATAVRLGANQISNSWTATSSGARSRDRTPSRASPSVAATGDNGYMGPGDGQLSGRVRRRHRRRRHQPRAGSERPEPARLQRGRLVAQRRLRAAARGATCRAQAGLPDRHRLHRARLRRRVRRRRPSTGLSSTTRATAAGCCVGGTSLATPLIAAY